MGELPSTFVERAARAMAGETAWGPHHNDALREYFRDRARKVMRAMREPTHEMLVCGTQAGQDAFRHGRAVVQAIWQAMIDEGRR